MTHSKSYNIMVLCNLRGIEQNSEEAEQMKSWSVLELLNAINEERQKDKIVPTHNEDDSFTRRAGCEH